MEERPSVGAIRATNWQKGAASVNEGSQGIRSVLEAALKKGHGCLMGRNGSTELTALSAMKSQPPKPPRNMRAVLESIGIFPTTDESVIEQYQEQREAIAVADSMAVGWQEPLIQQEQDLLEELAPKAYLHPLRSLEPQYSEPANSWMKALEGQSVCVVSLFTRTAEVQIRHRNEIWPGRADAVLPKVSRWHFVKSQQSPMIAQGRCEWPIGITSWKQATEQLFQRVMATDAKVVLIGCGALGMPLARRLKEAGRCAIVMGGAIQVLFGIRGQRWKNHPVISRFWNAAWVSPGVDERPAGATAVEGGCQW